MEGPRRAGEGNKSARVGSCQVLKGFECLTQTYHFSKLRPLSYILLAALGSESQFANAMVKKKKALVASFVLIRVLISTGFWFSAL